MSKLCRFRGGIRIGKGYFVALNVTWPFVVMEVSKNSISLRCSGVKYEFHADAISSIKKYNGLFSKGLKIEHQVQSIPEFVVFWTFQRNSVIKCLAEHGYDVVQ